MPKHDGQHTGRRTGDEPDGQTSHVARGLYEGEPLRQPVGREDQHEGQLEQHRVNGNDASIYWTLHAHGHW